MLTQNIDVKILLIPGENNSIYLLAQATEDTTEPGPVEHLEPLNSGSSSDPVLPDVEVPAKPSDDSCNKNDFKAPHEIDSIHLGLCLVYFLKLSEVILCVINQSWGYLNIYKLMLPELSLNSTI